MKSFTTLAVSLLVSFSVTSAAPIDAEVDAPASELVVRQIGGGPGRSEVGTSWSRTWPDTKIKQPFNFDAIPRGGCAYDVVFQRDPQDTKYELAYYSLFGEGEV
jgi:opacity protein-like surface antigen